MYVYIWGFFVITYNVAFNLQGQASQVTSMNITSLTSVEWLN